MNEKNEFNYPLFNEKGEVNCQICGKPFMILTPSHLKTHDMKYSEYSNKFPGAPTTTEQFKALSMYSRPNKYTDEDLNMLGKERVIDEDIPVIDDEFEVPEPKKQIIKQLESPMASKKEEIYIYLVNHLPHLEADYKIEIVTGPEKMMVFSAITDFADPVLKINFEFPDTFWHNMRVGAEDPNRNVKLKQFGWKVISIKSTAPSLKEIKKRVAELDL